MSAIHSFIFEATESTGVSKEWKSSTAPTQAVLSMYGHTPFCIKKPKNGTFARKRNGATGLKLGVCTT